MAFNLKQKLQEGKDATTKAFTKAVEGGSKLAGKVTQKVEGLRHKKEEPKNDAPKA